MTGGQRTAVDVELFWRDGAERTWQTQTFLTVPGVFPGSQSAQHLRRKSLVNLVKIEILQLQFGACQHARHRISRCHQQAFLLVKEIDRRDFAESQPGQHRQLPRTSPFFTGQQYR